jgi:hypothetical protein
MTMPFGEMAGRGVGDIAGVLPADGVPVGVGLGDDGDDGSAVAPAVGVFPSSKPGDGERVAVPATGDVLGPAAGVGAAPQATIRQQAATRPAASIGRIHDRTRSPL